MFRLSDPFIMSISGNVRATQLVGYEKFFHFEADPNLDSNPTEFILIHILEKS
jgi:hypothetical protein